jgi:RNA polymerase sigma-70 factor, ECF subfamily
MASSALVVADTTVGFQLETPLALAGAIHRDDAILLEGLRRADEAAYETLILRYEQPIFSLVSRLVDDAGDAADVVQEVFLKVFRNVGSFRGESSLKTWIYRIAVNEARNQRRWFGRHRRREVGIEPEPGEALGYRDWLEDPRRSPFQETLDHETRALIEDALLEVNSSFRSALVLRELEDLSYEEIGEILEISLGTVKSRILRGREALRKSLAKRLAKVPAERLPLVARGLRNDLA